MQMLVVTIIAAALVAQTSASHQEYTALLETTLSSRETYEDDEQCPPWFYYNSTEKMCKCYNEQDTKGDVRCTDSGALLYLGRCMTHEEGQGTFVGFCEYFEIEHVNFTEKTFIELPNNVTEINEYMCGPLNRKGLLCQKCIDGYGPAVISNGYTCSNCSDRWYNIPLYLFLEFVPITLFYLVVLLFRINVTLAPMACFIMFSQLVVFDLNFDITVMTGFAMGNEALKTVVKIVSCLYGIWNLDFLRSVIPPFCVSSDIKIIHVVFMRYISAFYPLFLIALTWICISLHDRNFKPLVWLWRPCHKCSVSVKRTWDTNNSIIDVFATFFVLSFNKLMLQSLTILSYMYIRNINGKPSIRVNAIDPSIIYFSKEHVPFVIVAIAILLVFVLMPTLLLIVYPTRVYRYCSKVCGKQPHNSNVILVHTFVEKFQGCFKDGTKGERDYRCLAAFYFILRAAVIAVNIIEKINSNTPSPEAEWFLRTVLFGCASLFFANIRPYKKHYMNILDTLMLALMTLMSLLILTTFYALPQSSPFYGLFLVTLVIVISLPQFGLTLYVVYKPFRNRKKWFKEKLNKLNLSRIRMNADDLEGKLHDCESPDRVDNPHRYLIKQKNNTQINGVSNYGSVNV